MEHFDVIFVVLKKWPQNPDGEFVALVLTGLLQYGLLTVGISIFLTQSFILIREKIKQD